MPSRIRIFTIVLLLVSLLFFANPAVATNVSGSAVISVDDATGITATGVPGDTIEIEPNVTVSNTGFGVRLNTAGYEVTNNGTVNGSSGGILYFAPGTLTNTGSISGNFGVGIIGDFTLDNSGSINGNGFGLIVIGDSQATNSGTIEGNFGVIITGGGTFTNSGVITSNLSTGLSFGGASTLTNSGTITAGGAAPAISMGAGDDTVILQTGSIVNGNINGGANNDTAILQGTGSFGFAFQNFETLRMEGSNWNLTGSSTIGTININNGTLFNNGTLTGAVNVNSGALLGGGGTVAGLLTNNGSVSPGNSIGTLNITGDYFHGANASLDIEFDATQSDTLNVSGTTTIQGGTLKLISLDNLLQTNTYTIIDSQGPLTGTFDQVISSPIFTTNVTYDTVNNDVIVGLDRNSYRSLGNTFNRRSLGSALDSALPGATGDFAAILFQLDGLTTVEEINAAFDQLSPQPLTAFPQITFSNAQLRTRTLVNRFNEMRLGIPVAGNIKQALPILASINTDSSLIAQILAETSAPAGDITPEPKGKWQPYVRTFGVLSDLDSEEDRVGFDSQTGGVTLGLDRWINDRWILGATLGGSYTHIDWDQSGTEGSVQSGHLAGYLGYSEGNWYTEGVVSYGINSFQADRGIRFGTINRVAESRHFGHEFSSYVRGGRDFQFGDWTYGPTASLQYIGLFEEGYQESGAGAADLQIENNRSHSLNSTLGFRIAKRITLKNKIRLVPEVQIRWAHEWLDNEYDVTAQFANASGGSFLIKGQDLGNDSALLGAGMTALFSETVAGHFNYEVDVGRSGLVNHIVEMGMTVRF